MQNIYLNQTIKNIISMLICLLAVALNVSISASQIILGILLIFLIIYLYQNKINIFKTNIYFLLFFIYWISTLFSIVFGSNHTSISGNLFAPWSALIFFVSYYFVTKDNIKYTIPLFIIALMVMSFSTIYYNFDQILRQGSISGGYMVTAHLISIGAVFTIAYILSGIEKRPLFLAIYILSACISIYGIIITDTRMPLLTTILITVILLLIKLRWKGIFLSILIIAVSIIYIINSPVMAERFAELSKGLTNPETSHGWRVHLWINSLELIKEYPIFGVGGGAFEVYMDSMMPQNINLPKGHAHNSYIMQLVTYGVVGFITFCIFYGKIAFDLVKNTFKSPYALIGTAVLSAYFLEALTENNMGLSFSRMQCLFLTGLMLGLINKNTNEK